MRRTSLAIPLAAVLGAVLLAACPKSKPAAPPPPSDSDSGTGSGTGGPARPDGAPCLVAHDCASGVCEGQGCTAAQPGTCAPAARACTKDLRPYCGCDGVTFRSSGSCPGARFATRGECGAPEAP